MGTSTRLSYTVTESQLATIRLLQKLGNPHKFHNNMKVRAMYPEVKIWVYGRVVSTGLEGKFISVKVERSKRYMVEYFRDMPLCFMTEGDKAWVEPYDY